MGTNGPFKGHQINLRAITRGDENENGMRMRDEDGMS